MGKVTKLEPIGHCNAIAVFGTSRSGKDYTIREAMGILAKEGRFFEQRSPIKMLQSRLCGEKLRDMDRIRKRAFVSEVHRDINIDRCRKGINLFVDEHYSFPERFGGMVIDNGYYGEKLPFRKEMAEDGRNYEVVFRDIWMENYEMVVYMEIDPNVILERFRTSEGDKFNPYITADDIRHWQLFELDRIQELCNDYGVPLYYIYDHTKSGEVLARLVDYHFMKYHSRSYGSIITGMCRYGQKSLQPAGPFADVRKT